MTVNVLDIAKRRGFFWPSFEIYGSCAGFYTYGPLGALLKLRIEELLRDHYVNKEGCLLIEAPILTPEDPWVASGHVESFTDMNVECTKCGEPHRADHLLEDKTRKTAEGMSLNEIMAAISKHDIKCTKCGGTLGEPYDYNMMFKTYIGPGKNKITGCLRPETAQTTYMPFRRLFEIGRKRLPLGVVQFGKAHRNEISPRQGLVRLREFSQAEVQFFMDPASSGKHPKFGSVKRRKFMVLTKGDQKPGRKPAEMTLEALVKKHTTEWIAYHLATAVQLFERMGIPKKYLRVRQHKDDERSFYSSDTWDVEYMSDTFGKIELVGIAARTDYDLKRHQEFSKQKMQVNLDGKTFIPHVIEVAYGIDRPLYSVMESNVKVDGDRVFFSFPPSVSPYQVAVFPLVRKDGLPKLARDVYDTLNGAGFYALYDEGFIGRLYYRQDEAGTPFGVTVDYDTKKDKAVTLRNRDNQKQVRVKIKDLVEVLRKVMSGQLKFEKAGKLIK
ncbi:MAG: glycine--tRNA ligase [Candidatus Aenigmatarchaeota archaeon]|nr:MAG: glycine--tRNA ligase [Candidatus Aenigmarchaeota archaeon]